MYFLDETEAHEDRQAHEVALQYVNDFESGIEGYLKVYFTVKNQTLKKIKENRGN